MAINQIFTDFNPMVHSELACTQESDNIQIPSQPPGIDFCYCDFECEYEEEVFASPGNEDYKNDKSMFISELVDPTGTIQFKLYKGDETLLTTIIDNSLGEYTPLGGFPSFELTDHSLKSGFIASWELIYNVYGIGQYYFEIVTTNFGREVVSKTQKYYLSIFSEKSADKTFVIRTLQNGYINNGLDYTGLNWVYQYRIPGKFKYGTPEFEKTTYLNSDRDEKQIQSQIIRTYEMSVDFIPSSLSKPLIEDNLLSNSIDVMSYNLWNQQDLIYNFVSVVLDGIEEVEDFERSQNANYIFTFSESSKNRIKRNFK